jgi:hypothetical protein
MSPSLATFIHFMPSNLFVLRSIVTLPSYPCEIHILFLMALPTPLTEWPSNASKCTRIEWDNHKTATKVVLLVCSNYHITHTTQVCTVSLLLFKLLSVRNFLFINHSNCYDLFNHKKIYKWAWKYTSSVLPACILRSCINVI